MTNDNQITIKNLSLKELLKHFEEDAQMIINELGDTCHPAAGFVDESYFKNVKTVQDFLQIDYDFVGLVAFDGRVNNLQIHFDNGNNQFIITGDKKELEMLNQKLQ